LFPPEADQPMAEMLTEEFYHSRTSFSTCACTLLAIAFGDVRPAGCG